LSLNRFPSRYHRCHSRWQSREPLLAYLPGQASSGKGGRPKKNAEAIGLAAEAFRMIGAACALLAQAMEKGLFG
jgi:hypothetical protein